MCNKRQLLARRKQLPEDLAQHLKGALSACRSGVKRIHLIDRQQDGALLKELFTRDGIGTLITAEPYEETRTARIDDVGGLLELLEPLEEKGVLVRRSRELLETEIGHFTLMERDGMVIASAALYPYPQEAMAELACVAVHPDYRGSDRGNRLLAHMEAAAKAQGIERLFILTTQSTHWFRERGFVEAELKELPMHKRQLYNYRRNSKVFIKALSD
jgi:amino-acid N-acetyltransferase